MASNDPPERILQPAGPGTLTVADLIELGEIPHHNLFPLLGVKAASLPQTEAGATYVIVALPAGLLRALLQSGLRGWQGSGLTGKPADLHPEPIPQDHAPIEPLSPREREVLQLMAHGASNRTLARDLVISPATVKKHVSNILRKVGARNRTEAVRHGRRLGLCD